MVFSGTSKKKKIGGSWSYIYLLLWSADVIQQSPKANIDAAFMMC